MNPIPTPPPGTEAGNGGGIPRTRRAFTLVELMGVMVVMGLLTMSIVPALIREYDKEARNREVRSLERLADGLVQYVVRTRSVPAPTNLVAAIAQQLGMHTNEVVLNERGAKRVILVDPSITNRLTLPYAQTYLGNTNNLGNNIGVVILSSVGADLPANLIDGYASSATLFQNIWNCVEEAIPSGLTFAGSGSDLRIQRLNLATLFVPLVLNYDVTDPQVALNGRFTIDTSTTNTLPTSPVWVSSYIRGTVLGLHDQAGSTNSLQAREVLQNPMSYVFQNSIWRGSLLIGPTLTTAPTPTDVQAAVDQFIESAMNSNAQGNPQTTQNEVVSAIITYITNYVNWADAGFPTNGNTYSNLTNAQQVLDDTTEDVIHTPVIPDNDTDPDGEGHGVDPVGGGTGHDSDGDGFCDHPDCDHDDCDHDDDHDGWDDDDESDHDSDHDGWDDHDSDHDGHCDTSHTNNGHGNNTDGVDSSNPGQGNGGPTGQNNSGNDPSGGVDDEDDHDDDDDDDH